MTVRKKSAAPGKGPRVGRRCWLMKTEPTTFSFDDLMRSPGRTTGWSGVRNYQARNLMRDELTVGDQVFIYHSSTDEPAVVGIAQVVRAAYPDPTALDPRDPHHDARSRPEAPTWVQVDVRAVRALARPVTLVEMRGTAALREMALLRKGNRLSVQPVREAEWTEVCRLGDRQSDVGTGTSSTTAATRSRPSRLAR